MQFENSPDENQIAELTIRYLDENYHKVVRPSQLFLIPNYFIHYWLARLGPTMAWIVVSLQQAYWRSDGDRCAIAQSTIAEEIGIHRHTVAKELHENPWRSWHIPQIAYQKGVTDRRGVYRPLPNQYQIYEPTPLIPEHLAGLHEYFRIVESSQPEDIRAAIEELLSRKPKDCLALLEQYAAQTDQTFEAPQAIKSVVELATGLRVADLPPVQQEEMKRLFSGLQYHLLNIGKTICRQYFRREWVPLLGPSLAWLVTVFRSRCYYNLTSGELRDTATWRKKEIKTLMGQSKNNLQNLLKHPYADHFIRLVEQRHHTLTVRVALAQEPLIEQSADQFWQIQAQNSQKFDMTPPDNSQKFDITPAQNSQKLDMTPQDNSQKFDITPEQTPKSSTSPPQNSQNLDTCKYFKKKVPNTVEIPEETTIPDDVVNRIKTMLSEAGLSGRGLNNLCRREPPLDPQKVRAVILYAEANGLGPGYIYRHLERDDPVEPLFAQFAALDAATLARFREGLAELQTSGLFAADLQTPIPAELADLFGMFAHRFGGLEAEAVARLLANPPPPDEAPPPSPEEAELAALWNQALSRLQLQTPGSVFETWLRDTRLVAREEGRFTIAVKNNFAQEWLENRLYSLIHRVLRDLIDEGGGESIELEFIVLE